MVDASTTRTGRWTTVIVVAALLVCAPAVVRSWPATDRDLAAATLLDRVRDSDAASWSGLVATEGGIQLPDAGELDELAGLLGERTRLRAWWRDDDRWRVDRLLAAGEAGLRSDGAALTSWDYERDRATVSRDPDTRLPRTTDLLPPVLGRRLVSGLTDAEVSRLPAERVAGRSALGLRVDPASTLTTIDHADLWVDAGSGLPLRVAVYAAGSDAPALTSAFVEVDLGEPDPDALGLRVGSRVDVEFDQVLDLADAADQYAPARPPATVLGLERSSVSDRAVGVYGRGVEQLVAIPLREREADPLREQLRATPGAATGADATATAIGPLGLLVTGDDGDGGWLLAGSVTLPALQQAAAEVVSGATYVDDR